MDDNTASKLVAFIAYHLGADSRKPGVSSLERSEMVDSAIRLRDQIRKLEKTHSNVRREIMFTLTLAEINRLNNDLTYRVEAMELSDELAKQDGGNPFEYYMEIVNLTSQRANAGNFGDIGLDAASPIRNTQGGWYREDPEEGTSYFRPSEIHETLRAYPKTPAALSVVYAKENCSMAR